MRTIKLRHPFKSVPLEKMTASSQGCIKGWVVMEFVIILMADSVLRARPITTWKTLPLESSRGLGMGFDAASRGVNFRSLI